MFFDLRNRFVGFFFRLEGALTLFSATSILARDIIMCYVTKNLYTEVWAWASSKNSSPVSITIGQYPVSESSDPVILARRKLTSY